MWPIFLIHWDFDCVSSRNTIILSLLLFLELLKESHSFVEDVIKSRHLSLAPTAHHLPFSEAITSSPFSRYFWHLPPCPAFHSGGQIFFLLISPDIQPHRHTQDPHPIQIHPFHFLLIYLYIYRVSVQSSCSHYSINTINSQGTTWMGL